MPNTVSKRDLEYDGDGAALSSNFSNNLTPLLFSVPIDAYLQSTKNFPPPDGL
jgi:hypothetical protein